MSFREKMRKGINTVIYDFINLSTYKKLLFIGVLGLSFIILIGGYLTLFGFDCGLIQFDACWGPLQDDETIPYNVPQRFISEREVYSEPIDDFKISYYIEGSYSSKGVITVDRPTEITIRGRCVVNKSKLDTPEYFTIKFCPQNALNRHSEDSAFIRVTANKTDDHFLWAGYEFNGRGTVEFQRSGYNPLWVEFTHFGLDDRNIGDIFDIGTSSDKSRLEGAIRNCGIYLISFYVMVLTLIAIINAIVKPRQE